MKNILFSLLICLFAVPLFAQTNTRGATEKTPSKSEYFSWINNTNEGATESQTLANLAFFRYLHDTYGMELDIYAFDAGALDGKRYYGDIHSDRFKSQFPNGFHSMYKYAKEMNTRLGIWGGPDGFGNTPEEERQRTEQMVSLCRDYDFALFKFDAVCGALRPEKEEAFIHMMKQCRTYSPDLILLNHRLGLEKAEQYATTFLWEGWETYIDVFMNNSMTAPHHRAQAIARGVPKNLTRLTEDHGVCISSCPDYWDDDLIVQAFNRNMILAPQIYGNPWFIRESELPKMARIFNIHKKYNEILVNGFLLPEEKYGAATVSRGDDNTRFIVLRNLSWEKKQFTVSLSEEIGLKEQDRVFVMQYHPGESFLGEFAYADKVNVEVLPFRVCLLKISGNDADILLSGSHYEVINDHQNNETEIALLSLPGETKTIQLQHPEQYSEITLNGKRVPELKNGEPLTITFPGTPLQQDITRRISGMDTIAVSSINSEALYEATVFAADNNALEVRAVYNPMGYCQVKSHGGASLPGAQSQKKAIKAFLNQETFINRGIWDKNLFDGDLTTGFWPSTRYGVDQRVKGGCFRLDMGEIIDGPTITLHVPDMFALQPLLEDEAYYASYSADLKEWKSILFMAGTECELSFPDGVRYIRIDYFPQRINEVTGTGKDGKALNNELWRASNLFAPAKKMIAAKAWKADFVLDEIAGETGSDAVSYLCVAIEGEHGKEGAYAAAIIDGELRGAADRATSYPSNTWEYVNARSSKNYTYYIPLRKEDIGKDIAVFVTSFEEDKTDLVPEVYISTTPFPMEKISLRLKK